MGSTKARGPVVSRSGGGWRPGRGAGPQGPDTAPALLSLSVDGGLVNDLEVRRGPYDLVQRHGGRGCAETIHRLPASGVRRLARNDVSAVFLRAERASHRTLWLVKPPDALCQP